MSKSTDASTSIRNASNLMALRKKGGRALMVSIAMPLVSGALLVAYAALLAQVLGRTIEGGESLGAVFSLILIMVAIVVIRAILGLVGEQAGQIGAERIKAALRAELFGHLLAQRHALGLKPASGAVSAALIDQVERLESFFARYLPAMVAATILPVAFAVVLFPVDWIVAVLFLFTAPLIPVFMALAGWGAQGATDRQATALTRLSAYFADRLRGLLTLKLFGQEQKATEDVHKASEALRRRTNRVLAIAFLSSAILEFFAALGVAGVALYVGLTYLGFLEFHPSMTLVAGLFALIMAPEVYNPLRQLAAHYHDRAAAKSALAEIEAQIADISALDALPGTEPARPDAAAPVALAISDLTVRTQDGVPVLDRLDLDLPAGRSLAVMGESGIGKSTLARAIARLIPYAGTITLDGISARDWPEPALRKTLAYIAQKPRIFTGTIAENIGFANPAAAPQAIRTAAEKALVTGFTDALPDGLQTLVGEGGLGLSGGQIQRIGIARLFLTDPGLVILDEPTAHLDADTQAELLDSLFAFAQGRTLVILTHASAVAERCESVLRLAGGTLLPTPRRTRAAAAIRETRA